MTAPTTTPPAAAPQKENGAAGESTGALDSMLAKIAEFYEDEVDIAVAGLVAVLEPVLISILGVIVGGIVISMYLPLFDLINQLSKH